MTLFLQTDGLITRLTFPISLCADMNFRFRPIRHWTSVRCPHCGPHQHLSARNLFRWSSHIPDVVTIYERAHALATTPVCGQQCCCCSSAKQYVSSGQSKLVHTMHPFVQGTGDKGIFLEQCTCSEILNCHLMFRINRGSWQSQARMLCIRLYDYIPFLRRLPAGCSSRISPKTQTRMARW